MAWNERTRTAWSTFGVPMLVVAIDLLVFAPQLVRSDAALRPSSLALVGYGVIAAGALTLRHRFPVHVFLGLVVHALLAKLFFGGQYIPTIALLASLTAVATHYTTRRSLAALVLTIATVLAGVGPFLARYRDDASSVRSFSLALAVYGMFSLFAWTVGWWTRLRRERIEAAARELEQASELEQARMTRAVMDERLRIASELHDLVASSVTVMVLQAAGGAKMIDRDPERARESLQHIESTGTEAMAELRRMLGVLRSSEGLDPGTAGSEEPGIRDLQAVLVTIERAGVSVDLHHEGDVQPLDEIQDLTVSRVVQESLTNTVKYAGKGATAEVALRWAPSALVIEILDDGGGAAPELSPGMSSGAGLVGLRERVTALGGSFEAGPRQGGGFRVCAQLPLGPVTGTQGTTSVTRLSRALASLATFQV